jgi:hypothetical protein
MALFQPTAPCLIDPVLEEAKLLGIMRIGVDGDLHADLSGAKQMQVVQVESVGLRVQFNGYVVFLAA